MSIWHFYDPGFYFIFLKQANKQMQDVVSWTQMHCLQFQSSSVPKDKIAEQLTQGCTFITFPSRNENA